MNHTDPNTNLLTDAINGDIKGLISAIYDKADVNYRSFCNNTALMFASSNGDSLIINMFLV
jgi:hypothetical protein